MIMKNKPVIGITMGDPSGIGPEIILKSFQKPAIRNKKLIVIGDYKVMKASFDLLKIKSFKLNRIQNVNECSFYSETLNVLDLQLVDMKEFCPAKVNSMSGNAAFEAVHKAVELAQIKEIEAVVTAPLNKEALHLAGHIYPGHTEIFALLTGTKDYAMFLYDKKLSVIHVSTHISLLEAITGLKRERIEKVIVLADGIMKKLISRAPRIAVAGINPHAGENGLFGNEEIKEIGPAVRSMKEKGINVEGPCPPDTVFLQAVNGKYDIVVAMYHDQGHIPLKLLGFNTGVNVTVGLPFIRTSVDHGTAFDIAWQGKASESSMVEAVKLATKLA
jgi:4-hydroxythreonine-4-phosphate dehydrogenase